MRKIKINHLLIEILSDIKLIENKIEPFCRKIYESIEHNNPFK